MKSKHCLSFLLATVFLFSLMPAATARADGDIWNGSAVAPTSGNGTAGNPYEISTAEHLAWFAQQVNSGNNYICGKLVSDIILNDTTNWEDWASTPPANTWTPIGNIDIYAYNGTFDGNYCTISGIYVGTGSNIGLFGRVGGTVKNLIVEQSFIKGSGNVGVICGSLVSNAILNCENYATAVGSQYVGGICGDNNGTIKDCDNYGTVSSTGARGGICGRNYKTISNCKNAGTITGDDDYAGGICGRNQNDGLIEYCANAGSVNCGGISMNIGGIVGQSEGTVSNVINIGSVKGGDCIGGICGANWVPNPYSSKMPEISHAYNIGSVSANGGGDVYIGSVCGFHVNGEISNAYYLQQESLPGIGETREAATGAAVAVTQDAVESGELAYLLRTGGGGFGQPLGDEDVTVPVFLPWFEGSEVYRLTYMDGGTVHAV